MKSGMLLNLPFFILHGVGVFGSDIFSTCFIWSCFMVWGGSPDCLMIVKNAFSRSWRHCSVILLISFFSMSLFFICFHSYWGLELVAFFIIKVSNIYIIVSYLLVLCVWLAG